MTGGRQQDRPAAPAARRWVVAVLAVLIGLLTPAVTACSVGIEEHPHPLGSQALPDPHPPRRPGDSGQLVTESTPVYWVRDGHLVAEQRVVTADGTAVPAVDALLAGPSETETAAGLHSALPAGLTHLQVRVSGDVAVVGVPAAFFRLGAVQQVEAVGQLVYTVTAAVPVAGVQLRVGDKLIQSPTGSGRLVARPLHRSDFQQIAPV